MAADVAIQVASDVANEGSRQPCRLSQFLCGRARGGKGTTYMPLEPILCHQDTWARASLPLAADPTLLSYIKFPHFKDMEQCLMSVYFGLSYSRFL